MKRRKFNEPTNPRLLRSRTSYGLELIDHGGTLCFVVSVSFQCIRDSIQGNSLGDFGAWINRVRTDHFENLGVTA